MAHKRKRSVSSDRSDGSTRSDGSDQEAVLGKQLETLKIAIQSSKPPYCAGVLPLLNEKLILYYGKEQSGR